MTFSWSNLLDDDEIKLETPSCDMTWSSKVQKESKNAKDSNYRYDSNE